MTAPLFSESFSRRERWRLAKDRLVRYAMATGGMGVIIAILLIFVYLFYVVLPLFTPPSLKTRAEYRLPESTLTAPLAYAALDEYAEVLFAVAQNGDYAFVDAETGSPMLSGRLLPKDSAPVTALARSEPDTRVLAIAAGDGKVTLVRHDYAISFPNDVRQITPKVVNPLPAGTVFETGLEVARLAVGFDGDQATVVAADASGVVRLVHATLEESFLDGSLTAELTRYPVPYQGGPIVAMAIDVDQRELYLADAFGVLHFFDVQRKSDIRLVDTARVVPEDARVTRVDFLSGGISLLVSGSDGTVSQWFPVRDAENRYELARVREFASGEAAVGLTAPEYHRKAFAALDATGRLALYHATAEHRLVTRTVDFAEPVDLAFGPRADNLLLAGADGRITLLSVHNEHPEVSLKSLWGKVWYESRQAPEFIWQSSSASSDFEPKFSLTPLTFGTIKAAFYAMLFAMPLAIFGALYTAYFMTPRMRSIVKPSIEVMEALPTVILGFLAGLWLAPLVERHLPGVFLVVVILPGLVLSASFGWSRLPERVRYRVPDGWEAALLVPVVMLAFALSLTLSYPVERLLFDGDMPHWLAQQGIDYDQRNSLVVGLAMGFAVIPTIFSISEDAVFSVPRHLTTGSLALGATPWQTVTRVVILTASPGIFSAVMIGLGRAVGETMIVLMATGNTPIMDANIFQGFRALSANIAVEMPESEVGSTHYRILFLAALVLFLATFVVNTVAEIVRQKLRRRYSSM